MKPQRDRIRIDVLPPSDLLEEEAVRGRIADEAIIALARLIGRQMARELFQEKTALERRSNNARTRNMVS
ncbi:hypothetical protein ATN84_06790 [Paramesorhizobium deserti]|uniref:Transposase n=1 Tax=Paramesorhizobium deserti TaxID=1494590 RepID=A0A135I1T5_9HYPH|nr:hypothetical protein [Paramesorhizobium deserti]KXF79404.1 hypothetical protein ATN84_06790 [Paramesorhizobium deserti]